MNNEIVKFKKFILIFIFGFWACKGPGTEKKVDTFYEIDKKGDVCRIPLIKPFKIVSTGGIGYDWLMMLPNEFSINERIDQISNIKMINVADSVIIIYSDLMYVSNQMSQVWTVIDTQQKSIYFYLKEEEYIAFFKPLNRPDLFEINKVYADFVKYGRLPWK